MHVPADGLLPNIDRVILKAVNYGANIVSFNVTLNDFNKVTSPCALYMSNCRILLIKVFD